jgi:hypothetical protein
MDHHLNVTAVIPMGYSTMIKYKENRDYINPKLHSTYIPAAVFVPMYGRMMLYNYLQKFGKRVVMCDTDSLIMDVEGLDEDIVDSITSDVLGALELESDVIMEFVALGPKTYAFKNKDGSELVKCKGVGLKRSHKNLVNFDTFKSVLFEGGCLKVPQLNFDYKIGVGTYTRKSLKDIKFDKRNLKGNYDPETFYVHPFGYRC